MALPTMGLFIRVDSLVSGLTYDGTIADPAGALGRDAPGGGGCRRVPESVQGHSPHGIVAPRVAGRRCHVTPISTNRLTLVSR